MLTVNQCPVCAGKKFSPFITCTDYTVSHETFSINRCTECGLLVTSPRPNNHDLPRYYLSTEYISHSNKSTSLADKLYKLARYFALRWKVNLINKYSSQTNDMPRSLLDVGCGTGEFLDRAQSQGWKISGVEPSAIARTQAASLTGINIHQDLDETTQRFSVITLWHVLEHVPDLNSTMEKLTARLEDNGTIFIAVPNYQSRDAKTYQAHWAGYDVPRHLWHFDQRTMKKLLNRHGLILQQTLPMKLDSFYVSLLSEKYIRNKNSLSGMIRAFYSGMQSNLHAIKTSEYSSLIYLAHK